MGSVLILDVLYAAGIALSPTPIVVVILILFSTTKRRVATAYLIGWVIGLLILAIVLVWLSSEGLDFFAARTPAAHPIAELVIGLALVGLGFNQWRKRPDPN